MGIYRVQKRDWAESEFKKPFSLPRTIICTHTDHHRGIHHVHVIYILHVTDPSNTTVYRLRVLILYNTHIGRWGDELSYTNPCT